VQRKTTPVLLALTAVILMSAIGTESASAAACTKKAGATHDYVCINGTRETGRLGSESEAQSETVKSGLVAGSHVSVEWKLGGAVINLTCEAMNGQGTLTSGGNPMVQLSAPAIEFTKCAETGKENRCTVERFVLPLTGHTGGSKSEPGLVQDVLFVGANSGELILQSGTKTCYEAGRHEFSSEIPCTIKEVEVEQVAKELACKGILVTREEHISVGFEAAMSLSGKNLGKKFSIYQGT
jgi:hypothetical protein